jgi:hypothetical protein
MDYQFAASFAATLGFGLYSAHLQRQQLRIMQDQLQPSGITQVSAWWSYRSVAIVVVLMALSWLPYVLGAGTSTTPTRTIGGQPTILRQTLVGGQLCGGSVDVSQLKRFGADYDVALMCGFNDPTVDRFEDHRTTITKPFGIHAQADLLPMSRPYSAVMTETIQKTLESVKIPKGAIVNVNVSTWTEIVLVRRGTGTSDIHKLSDVVKHGGKILSQEPL